MPLSKKLSFGLSEVVFELGLGLHLHPPWQIIFITYLFFTQKHGTKRGGTRYNTLSFEFREPIRLFLMMYGLASTETKHPYSLFVTVVQLNKSKVVHW